MFEDLSNLGRGKVIVIKLETFFSSLLPLKLLSTIEKTAMERLK